MLQSSQKPRDVFLFPSPADLKKVLGEIENTQQNISAGRCSCVCHNACACKCNCACSCNCTCRCPW